MDYSLVFHILIAFGAFQALFLSVIILTKKSKLGSKLFALFLLIEGTTLVERLLAETGLMTQLPHVLGISYPISFIKPPLLLILTWSITRNEFKLRRVHIFHGIPFVLMLFMNTPFYLMPGEQKVQQVASFINYVPAYDSFNFWFFLSFFAYIGVYLSLSIQILIRYRVHIKNNKLVNWFLWVIALYTGLLAIQLVHFLLRPSGLVEFPYINEASMLLMTFLIQSIAYSFLSQSHFFTQKNDRFIQDVTQLSKDSLLIKNQLEKEKVYLDDSISLEDFAKSIGLSKKQVSDVVNQHFGCSFKDLINQYRIEEAKQLMKSEMGSDLKLVQIGLRAGFNNKVSFYRTFKKFTGKSPSEFYSSLS